ncbi:MAG: hypothetical protein WB561_23345 [Terracidiphilus sp.]
MLIMTTIYFAKPEGPTEERELQIAWAKAADLKEAAREWMSSYEGKNRVLPIDQNNQGGRKRPSEGFLI